VKIPYEHYLFSHATVIAFRSYLLNALQFNYSCCDLCFSTRILIYFLNLYSIFFSQHVYFQEGMESWYKRKCLKYVTLLLGYFQSLIFCNFLIFTVTVWRSNYVNGGLIRAWQSLLHPFSLQRRPSLFPRRNSVNRIHVRAFSMPPRIYCVASGFLSSFFSMFGPIPCQ